MNKEELKENWKQECRDIWIEKGKLEERERVLNILDFYQMIPRKYFLDFVHLVTHFPHFVREFHSEMRYFFR